MNSFLFLLWRCCLISKSTCSQHSFFSFSVFYYFSLGLILLSAPIWTNIFCRLCCDQWFQTIITPQKAGPLAQAKVKGYSTAHNDRVAKDCPVTPIVCSLRVENKSLSPDQINQTDSVVHRQNFFLLSLVKLKVLLRHLAETI